MKYHKITFIGHRVQDMGGFSGNVLQDSINETIHDTLKTVKEVKDNKLHLLTGFNLGIEMWAAEHAYNLNINMHAYIPFDKPHMKWPPASQRQYNAYLKAARKKIKIDSGPFSYEKMHKKEIQMIEDADVVYTFFAQNMPIHKYLTRLEKPVINLMPYGEKDDYFIEL